MEEAQDTLYEIAEFYKKNFENRKFHLTAGNAKRELLEFDVHFTADQFKHLTGLHKLTDIKPLQRASYRVYNDILNRQITMQDIKKSKYLTNETTKRIEYFKVLNQILQAKKSMIRSVEGLFFTIQADYMITKPDVDGQYAHLFLKKNIGNQDLTFPVTFIIEPSTRYLGKIKERWTVLSVEELERDEKQAETENVLERIKEKKEEKQRREKEAIFIQYQKNKAKEQDSITQNLENER